MSSQFDSFLTFFSGMYHSLVLCQAKMAYKKVHVGKDQENAQSEKDSHSKNRGGKKPN